MEDIQLYISKGTVLRLEFLDVVHPTLVHIKADHWNFIYQLYRDDKLIDSGLFTPNYLIIEERQLLIIQEYDTSILNKENIKTDQDLVFNLRLFDFSKGKTGRFSKLTGGNFKLEKLVDSILIFHKQYQDVTKEFEVNINEINMTAVAER